jgi:hypothetical protein
MGSGNSRTLTVDEVVFYVHEATDELTPCVSSSQIADYTDVSKPTTRDRAKEAVEAGRLNSGTLSGVTVFWPADHEADGGVGVAADPEVQQRLRETFLEVADETREEMLETVEKAERDMADVSAQALTAAELDLWRVVRRFGVGTILLFLSLIVGFIFSRGSGQVVAGLGLLASFVVLAYSLIDVIQTLQANTDRSLVNLLRLG